MNTWVHMEQMWFIQYVREKGGKGTVGPTEKKDPRALQHCQRAALRSNPSILPRDRSRKRPTRPYTTRRAVMEVHLPNEDVYYDQGAILALVLGITQHPNYLVLILLWEQQTLHPYTHGWLVIGVFLATGHIAVQTGHLLSRNLDPTSIQTLPGGEHHIREPGKRECVNI